MKKIKIMSLWKCNNCGICFQNRRDWCDLGCGSDYNEMIEIPIFRIVQDYEMMEAGI